MEKLAVLELMSLPRLFKEPYYRPRSSPRRGGQEEANKEQWSCKLFQTTCDVWPVPPIPGTRKASKSGPSNVQCTLWAWNVEEA